MAKTKNFIICLLLIVFNICTSHASDIVTKVKYTYSKEIGVREASGKNDGNKVEEYLKSVGLGKGYSWCAAFVSWTYQQANVSHPKSAWAPSFFPKSKIIYQSGKTFQTPRTGDVFGIYYPSKKRIAHVGFIDTWSDSFVVTVEGNTNEAGSREGDGVYRKRRLKRQIYAVSRFIN